MPLQTPAPRRRSLSIVSVLLCAWLSACGGGTDPVADGPDIAASRAQPLAAPSGGRDVPIAPFASNQLELGTTIAGFPHKVDVYHPAGATRAIVFLHGNGGSIGTLAYTLGFSRSAIPSSRTVLWDWLSQNGVIAVLPQGQAAPGSPLRTWSNHIFNSGQDDVAFLTALAANVRSRYGVADVSLAGYSSGGMMSARVWCDANAAYKAFVSVAGPMMPGTGNGSACTPAGQAPYFVMLGAKDPVLPAYNPRLPPPTPEQAAAGLTAGFLVAEWTRHSDRSGTVCAEPVQLPGASNGPVGPTWSNCDDRTRYAVVNNADHTITSFELAVGARLADIIAGFVH